MQNLWLINIVRDMAKLDEYAIRLKNWTTLNPRNRNSYRYKFKIKSKKSIKCFRLVLSLLLITSGDYLTVSARHYTLSDRLEIDVRSPVFSKSEYHPHQITEITRVELINFVKLMNETQFK